LNVECSPERPQFAIELGGTTTDTGERMDDPTNLPPAKRRHVWPWLVAMLVIVGLLLAVVAIRKEARRVQEQRQFQMPSSAR